MPKIVMPSGEHVPLEGLRRDLQFSKIISDLENGTLENNYKVAVISIVSRIGKSATAALQPLKKILASDAVNVVKDAAKMAIEAIGESEKTTVRNNSEATKSSKVYGFSQDKKTYKKINTFVVKLEKIPDGIKELAFSSNCIFCDRTIEIGSSDILNKIFAGKENYCISCFKNRYYDTNVSRNIIRISYRKLIGYLVEGILKEFKTRNSYVYSEYDLRECIKLHVEVGLSNPFFSYSDETFQWQINVDMVRTKQVPVDFIFKTIALQLSALGIHEIFAKLKPYEIYRKICDRIIMLIENPVDANSIIYPSAFDANVEWVYDPNSLIGVSENDINRFCFSDIEKKKK